MKTKVLLLCYSLLAAVNLSAQLQFHIADKETGQAIPNAHAFLINTTYGGISDLQGAIEIAVPDGIQEDLLITHIAYETILLEHADYSKLKTTDTIFVLGNQLDMEEVVVTANRSNKWKKRYKRFQKAFLGEDKIASKCQINNPEVLRFEEKDGQLQASAIDLLQISNKHLGYKIYYLLRHLLISKDGSVEYLGQARFEDTSGGDKSILKNREKIFLQSPKHFFQNLIANNLEDAGYEMHIAISKDNQFHDLQMPSPEKLLKPLTNGNYQLYFPDFLKVVNKNVKTAKDVNKPTVRVGGLESQKFGGTQGEKKTVVEFAISYLYKLTPYLLINSFGNVLNTKKVKEYGYWADQRIAQQLPFNYGDDYTTKKKIIASTPASPTTNTPTQKEKLKHFTTLIYSEDQRIKNETLQLLSDQWEKSFIYPLVEIIRLSSDPWLVKRVTLLLQNKTGITHQDYFDWLQWLWEQEPAYESYYADFKGIIYQHIDPKFKKYFTQRDTTSIIQMDEIVWGGVQQDGIPPLRNPQLLSAQEADYLNKQDIVFGIYINGQARAYPKRILAWHEFFVDQIDTITIAGVYCTLCGTVIAYDMANHDLGTSGFLYRSNKLMYDKATQSLWSTIEGTPVVGPLVGQGISLATHPVITTTWGEWMKQHPNTKVLSLDTGYDRDYGEGVAYQSYFATDDLMFPVPKSDNRLNNKDEVFIVRASNYQKDPLAISIKYLRKKNWHQDQINGTSIIVLSDKTGAARAYEAGDVIFTSYKKRQLKDKNGLLWNITEDYLSNGSQQLKRLPAHNIFWFAWYNSTPNTRLIK